MPLPATLPHRCLVVIPARNEAASVGAVVRDVQATLGIAVLVVNDASQDATAAAASGAGARVLNLSQQLGAWGATQAGLRYAARRGFQRVLAMDADGQHHASSLPAMSARLDRGDTDVVIGSCEERLSVPKRIAWAWFRAITGLPVRDFTSGLRAYGSRALDVLVEPDASLLDYQDIGVLMLLKAHGLRLAEIDTQMSPRQEGRSRIFSSWLTVAHYMVASTILCLAQLRRRSAPAARDPA